MNVRVLLVVGAVLLVLAGVVVVSARAANIQCQQGLICYGTNSADEMNGTSSGDQMYGYGGADRMFGNKGYDSMFGGTEPDYLHGGYGVNHMHGGGGADTFRVDADCLADEFDCGSGWDVTYYIIGAGNSWSLCEENHGIGLAGCG